MQTIFSARKYIKMKYTCMDINPYIIVVILETKKSTFEYCYIMYVVKQHF